MSGALDLNELNVADGAAFGAAIAPLFEGAPQFLERLAVERPYPDWADLFDVARALAHSMPNEAQVELIDAHARLGAPPATVSAFSFREQGYGRRPADAARVAAELEQLNDAYERRFGFRYCVFVAGRSRADLLPAMRAALDGQPDEERHRALDAVVDIAIARLTAMRGPVA